MSNLVTNTNYRLTNPLPIHFEAIQKLCKTVYPLSKPWTIAQLESHRSYFPDGQLVVLDESDNNRVVGFAFSLIVAWHDYSAKDNWVDFTSAGYFHNHDPKNGKTLYGAEVMVDPNYRGQGIGRLLYMGRQEIVEAYNLKRIRAGARLRGYSKHKDKFTPSEYVKQVVEKKIYDPTLSFQLGRGFKAIDVAANYLYDDPESLGHAAVIEWLNPENNSEKEFLKQEKAVKYFLSGQKFSPEHLPMELRRLVRKCSTRLNAVLVEIEGKAFVKKAETYFDLLKKARGGDNKIAAYRNVLAKIKKEDTETLKKLVHGFTLHLEIVNTCETAYRTWRLRRRAPSQGLKSKVNLTYVLTETHAESRSKNFIRISKKLQNSLLEGLNNNFYFNTSAIDTNIKLLWLQPIKSKSSMPVSEHINSLLFENNMFNFILSEHQNYDLKFRTWTEGKKSESSSNFLNSKKTLERSRQHLIKQITQKIKIFVDDLQSIAKASSQETSIIKDVSYDQIISSLNMSMNELKKFQTLSASDGTKIKIWKRKFTTTLNRHPHHISNHEQILLTLRLIELFPALVMPIHIQESAKNISKDIKSTSKIKNMLGELSKISGALDLTLYVSGVILTHCESSEDIDMACKLIDKACKKSTLPVIPLFVSKYGIQKCKSIIETWLQQPKNYDRVYRHWDNKFEVMFNYSVTENIIGGLPARLLISKATQSLEKLFKLYDIQGVFFHGPGGLPHRGIGKVDDQINNWTKSSLNAPKVTLNGEMLHRLFSSKEILNSQNAKLAVASLRKKVNRPLRQLKNSVLGEFASVLERKHTDFISNSDQTEMLKATTINNSTWTPESKASKSNQFDLPHFYYLTLNRSLFFKWWGLGSTWEDLSETDKKTLKEAYSNHSVFRNYIHELSYEVEKVDTNIWYFYFDKKDEDLYEIFTKELQESLEFISEVTGEEKNLWVNPWLRESIYLRAPHINLLNLIQIHGLKTNDFDLVKSTLLGINSGMLTSD